MLGHQARRRGGGSRTAGVADALVLGIDMGKHPFQIRVDEGPGTHVLRLFLAPDEIFWVRVFADRVLNCGHRERIELLYSNDSDATFATLLSCISEVIKNFAAAKNDSFDSVCISNFRIVNQRSESAIR